MFIIENWKKSLIQNEKKKPITPRLTAQRKTTKTLANLLPNCFP